MDLNGFIVHVKRDETRLNTSNYEPDRPLPKGKYKKSNCINERCVVKWKNHE